MRAANRWFMTGLRLRRALVRSERKYSKQGLEIRSTSQRLRAAASRAVALPKVYSMRAADFNASSTSPAFACAAKRPGIILFDIAGDGEPCLLTEPNVRVGSNCDLQHHLAQRPICGDKPTLSPERRQCAGKRTLGSDPPNFGYVP